MKQNSTPYFSFIVLLIVFLGGYSYFVYAAAPPGGYAAGQTLDPNCAPGDTDCIVAIGGGSVTADNGLTLTGSNVQLGGTLTQDTIIDTDGNLFGVAVDIANGLDTTGVRVDNGSGVSAALFFGGSALANASVNMGVYSFGSAAFAGMSYTDTITTNETSVYVGDNNAGLTVNDIAGNESLGVSVSDSNIGINYQVVGWGPDQSNGFLVNSTGAQVRGSDPDSGYNMIWAVYDPLQFNNVRENAFLYNNGNWQWMLYPSTRDDSGVTTPANFLYTDISGNVLSAPLSGILPTGVNGLENIGSDIGLGGTLTQNTTIIQDTFDFTVVQGVPATGSLVMTQGLTTVTGFPGNVMGYIAANGDGARTISWASGASNNLIHTLSGSGDPDLLFGGAEIRTDYDITDTSSAMASLYAFDTPGGKASRLQLTPTYLNLLLDPTAELRINSDPGTARYVISSNGAGAAPTWEDPAMLVSDERLKSNIADLTMDALSKIMNVRTVTYTLNSDDSNRSQVGFLAQDLQQHFPELVGEKADGTLGVYYAQMAPVLVEAIRELNIHVTTLDDVAIDNPVREGIMAWLSDTANGITKIYADIFESKQVQTEQLCIKDVCMDRDQLYNLMNQTGSVVSSTPEPVIEPENPTIDEPVPESEPDPETDPETGNSDQITTE